MMNRIVFVKPMANTMLLVGFQNGIEKTYDVKIMFEMFPQMQILEKDKALFNNVVVDTVDTEYHGTIILILRQKKSGKTERKSEMLPMIFL